MKVKWTVLVDDACGQVDKKHYARHEVSLMLKRGENIL